MVLAGYGESSLCHGLPKALRVALDALGELAGLEEHVHYLQTNGHNSWRQSVGEEIRPGFLAQERD